MYAVWHSSCSTRRVSGGEDQVERRRFGERRLTGSEVDVSRVEHENLYRQVDQVLRRVKRIELELAQHHAKIDALEEASGEASHRHERPK